MQRAAAASSSALRRLAAEAFNRPPVLSRAASLVATTFSRPLAASDRHSQLTLLYPICHPCRCYAKRRDWDDDNMVGSDSDEENGTDVDSEEDDDLDSDEDNEARGEYSEAEEEE